jgi:hypothetical protein
MLTDANLLFPYSISAKDYNLFNVINSRKTNTNQIEIKSEIVKIENISPDGCGMFKYDCNV